MNETPIPFHPLANIFPLIDGSEFDDLANDIREHGVREPVWIYGGKILDGRNRYRAAQAAGVDCPLRTYEGADPVAFVVSLNLKRRHMTESQRAMVAAKLANLKSGQRADRRSENLPTLPDIGGEASEPAVTQSDAAGMLNVSDRSLRSAKRVQERGAPELQAAVEGGDLSVSLAAQASGLPKERQAKVISGSPDKVDMRRALLDEIEAEKAAKAAAKREARQQKERDLAEKIRAGSEQMQTGKQYGVILADPPWRFEPYSRDTGMDRAADNHYPTSSTDEICGLPVPAAADAVLFLWATAPMLPDALRVMGDWGFAYKSHLIWAKDRIGTGYWARNKHELLLIGTRGSIPAPSPGTQPESLIPAPVSQHSAKPEAFHELIERLFPTLPRLEMFARSERPGWDLWGAEAPDAAAAE